MTTKTEEQAPEVHVTDEMAEAYMGKKFDKKTLGRPPKAISDHIKVIKRRKFIEKNARKPRQLIEKSRLDLFLEEYERNGGNGTEAAMTVFGLNRASASTQATIYLKQSRDIGRMVLEKQGITLEKLLKLAWEKAQVSKDTAYFDRLMKLLGEDFMSKQVATPTTTININQAQKEVRDEFGFGEIVDGEIKEDG